MKTFPTTLDNYMFHICMIQNKNKKRKPAKAGLILLVPDHS